MQKVQSADAFAFQVHDAFAAGTALAAAKQPKMQSDDAF